MDQPQESVPQLASELQIARAKCKQLLSESHVDHGEVDTVTMTLLSDHLILTLCHF